MYRVVHRTAPVYLAELCQPCTDPRTSSIHMRRFRDTTHQPSFHEHFIFFRCTNCLEQTTYPHIRYSYLYNSVIVSIQTQDSTVHYIICCLTMYGAPELWLWSALEDAILIDWLIDWFIYYFIYSAALPYRTRPPIFFHKRSGTNRCSLLNKAQGIRCCILQFRIRMSCSVPSRLDCPAAVGIFCSVISLLTNLRP